MAFSDLPEPIVDRITRQLSNLCVQWGIKPLLILDGFMLWLAWTGLTWFAFALSLLFVEIGEKNDISLIDGLLGGLLVGLAQWQVLRPYLKDAHRWAAVSTLSWGALALFHIGAIGWMAPGIPNLWLRAIFGLAYGSYVGTVLGVGQWWIIRRQVMRAWRWIPLSAGSWAVAIAIGWIMGGSLRAASNLFVSEVVGLILAWGAIAALSGLGIVGLLYPGNASFDRAARNSKASD